jgi:hypothetical protein
MKRLLLLFGLLSTFALSAEDGGQLASFALKADAPAVEPAENTCGRASDFYASIGVGPLPVLLPVFGIGFRENWNHHGFDVSAQVATIVKATGVRMNLLYSYVIHPNPKGQTYVDFGAAVGSVFHKGFAGMFTSPELVVGRQWKNKSNEKRFCQAEISFPNFSWEYKHHENKFDRHDVLYFPVVTISYGFLF